MKNSKAQIRCLITAGATREYFDPVRFVSNPSTGKMGWNIALASRDKGWDTTLVLCESSALPTPDGIRTLRVDSTNEMLDTCLDEFRNCDILIMSAAVSDFRPKKKSNHKVKKGEMEMCVEFERTPDILKTLSRDKLKSQILVGFAAETDNVLEYAKRKLEEKNLDCILANSVGCANSGFASDTNKIIAILRDGTTADFGSDTKSNLAHSIIDFIAGKFFR